MPQISLIFAFRMPQTPLEGAYTKDVTGGTQRVFSGGRDAEVGWLDEFGWLDGFAHFTGRQLSWRRKTRGTHSTSPSSACGAYLITSIFSFAPAAQMLMMIALLLSSFVIPSIFFISVFRCHNNVS